MIITQKSKLKSKKAFKIAIQLFAFSFTLYALTNQVYAQSLMKNDQYIIRMGNFNSISGNVSNTQYKLGFTSGENAPGFSSGTNYRMRAGFQYIWSKKPFAFSVSTTSIEFGTLNPGEPISRTNTLSVTLGATRSYQVTASENHPLRPTNASTEIPDTTCDNGSCTESIAADWSSPLTYGFGYRCENIKGADCAADFLTTTSLFKQFANDEKNENSQVVMKGISGVSQRQSQITYKVNISATQTAGVYQNAIKYIAVPTL